MGAKNYISIRQVCQHYGIDEAFILILRDYEVIRIKHIDDTPQMHQRDLPGLERMLRLHQDLKINPEGLQAIHHLLQKMDRLHEEINTLKRKLNRYVNDS